ncbi:glycerophosphodiester phosphodiesterase family protein [Elizabethkingia sp. JS20170427COW]|uniref:glycerophosphodiester phosphodiesterase n=1 Tax=Elizabethkingia sp. JS20170427COW TaxID=2583851 RepID=UPI00111060C7|nr:glycerophosphodiester phosphodiesterase family protein [Elizabethkingia sp. JS20170427COW]QCX52454.1 glycerophosphodiester phosphodiesterase [Elizabethkingia sp. JS20170427COW]
MKKIALTLFGICSISAMAQTQLIAHRGYWNTPNPTAKNSVEALKNTQKIKVYGSEFDVHQTKDGVLVINHDNDINGVVIADTNFGDLKNQKLSNGEAIPTLKDYLITGSKDQNLKLIVEIKPTQSKELDEKIAQSTLALVKQLKLENHVEYISFSLNTCKALKAYQPSVKVQYLMGDLSPAQVKEIGLDGIDYYYKIFQKNPEWIAQAKSLGLITNAWTVNDIKVYQELEKLGIDFITTDTPVDFIKK